MWKNMMEPERPQMTIQYGACALHAGLPRLHSRTHMHTSPHPGTHTHASIRAGACTQTHTHTHKVCNLLLFHGNNDFENAPQCYVIRTLPVLLYHIFGAKYNVKYKVACKICCVDEAVVLFKKKEWETYIRNVIVRRHVFYKSCVCSLRDVAMSHCSLSSIEILPSIPASSCYRTHLLLSFSTSVLFDLRSTYTVALVKSRNIKLKGLKSGDLHGHEIWSIAWVIFTKGFNY